MNTQGMFHCFLFLLILLPFSMTTPTPSDRRRARQWLELGLGNSHSPMERAVSHRNLSVVNRQASRSLTGRGMGIHVHNNFS
jgi:hypothetical protein